MTGVAVNILSVVTAGNNVSLMPGVDVNELSVVTTYSNNRQYIYIYISHQ
jgi:hypothetical protein